MITFYLCDDNDIMREMYADKLQNIADEMHLSISIRTFASGEELVFELADEPNAADVLLLDVLMVGMNGIDAAKELRRLGCMAEIVFLTSSEEYVFNSFEATPFYYLLKNDATDTRFKEIMLKVYNIAGDKVNKVFQCEYKGVAKAIPYASILYFEVENRMVTIHFDDECFSFYSTMKKLCESIDDNAFFRTHRAYLVNLKYIRSVANDSVKLSNGYMIPVSSTYAKDMRLAIMKYHCR